MDQENLDNKNLKSPGLETSAPPEGQVLKDGPRPEDNELFFNVMPRGKNQGGLVEASIKVVSEDTTEQPSAIKQRVKKYKWYIIIAVLLLAGAPAVYFLAFKIGGGSDKSDIIVGAGLSQLKAGQNTQTQSTSTPAQTDFTTPQSWRDKYFPNCTDPTLCGDDADPDHDGLTNLQEYNLGTDPNNPDSDGDGISDGDEVNVFGSNPLNSHTAGAAQYSDADYIKGGYDFATGDKMTPDQIAAITAKMKQFGLHEPTITTLGSILNSLYGFSPGTTAQTATSTPEQIASTTPDSSQTSSSTQSGLDESLAGKQTRDTQRSNTILNIEIALVSYDQQNQTYPPVADFTAMYADIKPYLKVATNPIDPINQAPYIYSYAANPTGSDFSLTFYSEVAQAEISKNAADSIKDADAQQASIYDNQRESDLEDLRTALLLYSNNNIAGSQTYVFPSTSQYATALVPQYIGAIPKDPKTGADYNYQVSATFDTFTLKAVLDNPPAGTTGYMCDQDGCQNY